MSHPYIKLIQPITNLSIADLRVIILFADHNVNRYSSYMGNDSQEYFKKTANRREYWSAVKNTCENELMRRIPLIFESKEKIDFTKLDDEGPQVFYFDNY